MNRQKDPRAAVKAELGIDLPTGINIKVVEDTADTVHLVLPSKAAGRGSLSEKGLSGVSGGAKSKSWDCIGSTVLCG